MSVESAMSEARGFDHLNQPPGWVCTRGEHTTGPCALVEVVQASDLVERVYPPTNIWNAAIVLIRCTAIVLIVMALCGVFN
jgi:hypothetical protein